MKKIILSIFFIAILICDSKAQENVPSTALSDSIEIVKTLIRKNGSVTSYAIGIYGTLSNQFQRFIYLLNNLNTEQFIGLTKDTSTSLRIYAYAALAYNHYKDFKQLKIRFEIDSTLIQYRSGCLGGHVKANVIIAKQKQWYSKTTVTYALKQQKEDRSFWYTNYVFRN